MENKKVIKLITQVVIVFIVLWLFGSFIAWDYNVKNWSVIGRTTFILLGLWFSNKLKDEI